MSYKQPVSVLVVVHTSNFEVLLIERADFKNHWQSVTGSCEKDESLVSTAIREVYEETAIHVEKNELLNWQESSDYLIYPKWRHRYAPGVTINTEHKFSLCVSRDIEIKLKPLEHSNYEWLLLEEAANRCFSETNRQAIYKLPSMFKMHLHQNG